MIDDLEASETQPGVTRDEIERRVDDWLDRLHGMFASTEGWAVENGWRVASSGTSMMDEELMRRVHMSPRQQPTLRLEREDGGYALFKPKGLWVIGANGRIDLYTPKGAFIIIDQAGQYEEPRWRVFRTSDRREGSQYTPEILRDLV